MRNLRNLHFGRWSAADITSVCWDPETDELLCTVGPTPASASIELLRLTKGDVMYAIVHSLHLINNL